MAEYFDARWYLATYADVRESGVDPFEHFLTHGWKEGRWPTPTLDPALSRIFYGCPPMDDVNPFLGYVQRLDRWRRMQIGRAHV